MNANRAVGVAVGPVGVAVGVKVGVTVGVAVLVGVAVGGGKVFVAVADAVTVIDGVKVAVGVPVLVAVAVGGTGVKVGVMVGVTKADRISFESQASKVINNSEMAKTNAFLWVITAPSSLLIIHNYRQF